MWARHRMPVPRASLFLGAQLKDVKEKQPVGAPCKTVSRPPRSPLDRFFDQRTP